MHFELEARRSATEMTEVNFFLQVILTGDRTAVVDRTVIFSPASMLKIEPKIIRIAGVFFRVEIAPVVGSWFFLTVL